ncbi:hypothetical protein LZ31DRAFT_560940 [Colletotrichum somersetense]|nr:hypothetical protein LZ31DRAFT_560940 [Colletotrichum somersetense]
MQYDISVRLSLLTSYLLYAAAHTQIVLRDILSSFHRRTKHDVALKSIYAERSKTFRVGGGFDWPKGPRKRPCDTGHTRISPTTSTLQMASRGTPALCCLLGSGNTLSRPRHHNGP